MNQGLQETQARDDSGNDHTTQPLSFNLKVLMSTLQDRLTSSLNELIAETIITMTKYFENEISTLMNKVDSCAAKSRILEEKFTSDIDSKGVFLSHLAFHNPCFKCIHFSLRCRPLKSPITAIFDEPYNQHE